MATSKSKAGGKAAPTYLELREELSRRDRSLRDKVVSLEEATSFRARRRLGRDGGSTMSRTPMGMIWALIRAGRKGLTCSRSIVSSDGDLLFASGVCDHIITSWFSQSILWGVSKPMRHHVETRKGRGSKSGATWRRMRFRAGAMGVPFMPIPVDAGLGRPQAAPRGGGDRLPFTGEKILAGSLPSIRNVALIHVQRCDALRQRPDRRAAVHGHRSRHGGHRVILTTERIVSNDQIRRAPDLTKIPFFAVDAVSSCRSDALRTSATASTSR